MATTTNRMMKAITDTAKLNFITDHGSMRAMVRCACLAADFRTVAFGCLGCLVSLRAAPPAAPAAGLVRGNACVGGVCVGGAWVGRDCAVPGAVRAASGEDEPN